jgi:hypothetical protein
MVPPSSWRYERTYSHRSIIFGLLVDYEVAREWIKKTYQYELCSDHSEDIIIPYKLNKLVLERALPLGAVPPLAGWSPL